LSLSSEYGNGLHFHSLIVRYGKNIARVNKKIERKTIFNESNSSLNVLKGESFKISKIRHKSSQGITIGKLNLRLDVMYSTFELL
jgi:hypothetical protein